MEDLNKNQIILLTLLLSFVTSIATGIMTTSLLQQAPIEVNKTINQVVEKTIEKVVPQNIISSVSTPQTKEVQTVVVKEGDMIISAVSKNKSSLVRLWQVDSFGTENFFGFGSFISKDGTVLSDRKIVLQNTSYKAVLSDGTSVPLTLVPTSKPSNFILLRPTDDEAYKNSNFVPAVFAIGDVELGQSIISLGGNETDAISLGHIISLPSKTSGEGTSTVKYITSIETDLLTKDLVDGSPLFNLNGNLIGVKISEAGSKFFIPTSLVKKDIDAILSQVSTSTSKSSQ